METTAQPHFFTPEHVILSFLSALFSGKHHRTIIPSPDKIAIPSVLEVSTEFLETYRHNVTIAVQKRLVEAFKGRTFHLSVDGQTHQCRVTDSLFWEQLKCRFSEAPVQILWEILAKICERPDESSINRCTPWDAHLLLMTSLGFSTRFPISWFVRKKADWTALALRFDLLDDQALFNSDLSPVLSEAYDTPYPLRFVLIHQFSRFARITIQRLRETISAASSKTPGTNISPQSTMEQAISIFRVHLKQLHQFIKLLERWENYGTVGFDDARFIRHALETTRLVPLMQELQDELHWIPT